MTFLVELVETDPFTACRGKHPDRHGNQAKGKVAFPDSRSHLKTPSVNSLGIAHESLRLAAHRARSKMDPCPVMLILQNE
jgi:hypothetical protein